MDAVAHTDYTKYAELSCSEDLWSQRWGTFEKMSKDQERVDTFKQAWETIWLCPYGIDHHEAIKVIGELIESEKDRDIRWRLECCIVTIATYHKEEHTRLVAVHYFSDELREYRYKYEKIVEMIQNGLEDGLSYHIDKKIIVAAARTITLDILEQTR